MKSFLVLISTFLISVAFGQQACSCDNALHNLIEKIENDYPGFEDKTKDMLLYTSFKKQLIVEANSNNQISCIDVLRRYMSFFKDGHLYLSPASSSNENVVDTSEYIDVDMDQFFKDVKSNDNSIEGVWKYSSIDIDEVGFKLGIIKTDIDEYTGFVIPSKDDYSELKKVLFKLSSKDKYESHFPDKTKHIGNYELHDGSFIYFKEIRRVLTRDGLSSNLTEKQIRRKSVELFGFGVKQLSDKTTSISLPDFNYPFVEIINDLLEENRSIIENSEYLIVDIRGNGGGTGAAFQKLLPYIMTNAIRDMWIEFLVTPELIRTSEEYIEIIKDQKDSEKEVESIKKEIELFNNNMGQFVNTEDNSFTIQKVIPTTKSPKYVVILIDKGVASSGEDFVIAAKQSKKVKLIGTPTFGAIDYASVIPFDFGCPDYKLYMPTFRSLRLPDYPLDNIGVQPDIYLDKTVENWIHFAMDYLEN